MHVLLLKCLYLFKSFLADATETETPHQPTRVVRILEFESNINVNNRNSKADIELWDCSGDRKYSESWSALAYEQHGVIFVFNPSNESHKDALDYYYDNFVRKSKISDSCAIVFALSSSSRASSKVSLCEL